MTECKACPPEKPYYLMTVKAGKTYWWCSCSFSKKQPFCDGSHTETDKRPISYEATEDKDVYFCGCKNTKNPPFCDGSHKEC